VPAADQPEGAYDCQDDRQDERELELAARLSAQGDRAAMGMPRLTDPHDEQRDEGQEHCQPARALDQLPRRERHTGNRDRLKQYEQPAAAIAERDVAPTPDQQRATEDAGRADWDPAR
jgi:hypothetical protein